MDFMLWTSIFHIGKDRLSPSNLSLQSLQNSVYKIRCTSQGGVIKENNEGTDFWTVEAKSGMWERQLRTQGVVLCVKLLYGGIVF